LTKSKLYDIIYTSKERTEQSSERYKTMLKHIAYNAITGEVITTNNGRHLKRLVAKANRWAIKYGYPTGKWFFSHDGFAPNLGNIKYRRYEK
jgi:hypothetical protein